MHRTEKLIENILKNSVCKNDFAVAKREWEFKYIQYVPANGVCPCGQKHIKKIVVIQNVTTRKYLRIGSICAATALGIVIRDTDFKRLHSLYIIRKRLGRLATDYELVISYKAGRINRWELLFYLRCVKIQWSISEKQFSIIEQISSKLLQCLEHSDFKIHRILETKDRIGIFSEDQESKYRMRYREWNTGYGSIKTDIRFLNDNIDLQNLSMHF